MHSVLNDELLAALKRYASARRANSDLGKPLAAIVGAMEWQASSSISEADGSIADAAELRSWEPKLSWWRRLFSRRKDDLNLLSGNPEFAYLFVFHRNGFIRQAALERITEAIPNAFLVSAIAWRLNDWVPQVRDSAFLCATRCLPATNGKLLADFFFETYRSRSSWGRWAAREQDILDEAISRKDVREEIVSKLLDARQGPLPSFLAYLLRYEWIDQYLSVIASKSVVPGVRAVALRSLITGSARYSEGFIWRWIDKPMGIRKREPKVTARSLSVESDPKALIEAGVIDNSAVVRRVALSGLIELGLYNMFDDDLIERCAGDVSASVRSRAEFVRKKIAE